MLKRVVNVRPEEVRALLWSFAYFFCLLAAYYILRPLRDEMGVAGGVKNLQWLFTGTFLVMLAAVEIAAPFSFAWAPSSPSREGTGLFGSTTTLPFSLSPSCFAIAGSAL